MSEQFTNVLKSGKTVLTLEESRKVMELSGVPFNKSGLAKTEEDAVELAKKIGYPLVMKIVSPQIIHKTEVGGVKVNIGSDEELKKAYNEIIASAKAKVPDAEIQGILLEEMVSGTELIIGTTTDPQFGHMIMFGIGGIFVEVYKDVSFRLIPISAGDANEMLNELQGGALLKGVRGLPGADPKQLVEILMSVSKLVEDHPEIAEMDLNPLMITKRGTIAVDARILLNEPTK
ncbi:MAG: acetate--CoA ligase family protein [Thermoplasmata archaeon]|nr:MAG: acetate--CoA ligase family protein [Thermoplasmata archaeon]